MRYLLRHPGFTGTCVVSLAMGIGLATALASIADAILFHPLPVPDPGGIVRIYTSTTEQPLGYVSYLDFEDYSRGSRAVAAMVAQTQVLVAVGGDLGTPAKVRLGLAVSPNYFEALRVRAAIGRTFAAGDSHSAVVVLSDAFWRSEFGADRGLIGSTIRIGGARFTVLGVASRYFGMDRFTHESFCVPMGVYESGILPSNGRPLEDRSRRFLNVYGRVAPGATILQARAEFALMGARLESDHPESNRGRRALVLTEMEAREQTDRTVPTLARLLLAMGALVLAIAAANTGGLLLARAEIRARETAIRVALGATPWRLLRASLHETALLAIPGAALGIAVACASTKLVAHVATLPTDFPFAITPHLDERALMVTIGAIVVVIAVSSCAPSVKWGSWRDVLVASEVALATALAALGLWLAGGVRAANRIDPGFRPHGVLTMALDPAQSGYTGERTRGFYRELLDRFPGAALAQSAMLGYTRTAARVSIEGDIERTRTVWSNAVTPEYFALVRVPVVAGRGFDDRDTVNAPAVAIVNQEMAKNCGLGSRISVNGRRTTIVGIARNAKYFDVHESPQPYLYLPYAQIAPSRMVLHVASHEAETVLRQIRSIEPAMPVSEVRPLRDYLEQGSMFGAKLGADAVGGVGVCAMLLAFAGVYGVTSHVATRRRREIGIRLAIGATTRDVVAIVLRRSAIVAAVGGAGGLAIALASVRALSAITFGMGAMGWRELAAGLGAAALSMIAAALPARRATQVDPAIALRPE